MIDCLLFTIQTKVLRKMAPNRVKKPRDSGDSHVSMRPVSLQSPATTPTQNPRKTKLSITEGQKQALIDNLQLESKISHLYGCNALSDACSVTERARKLRAQYSLQAQSLRTRIELRINRIPSILRKANMGELLEKYTAMSQEKQTDKAGKVEAAKQLPESVGVQKPMTALEDEKTSVVTKPKGTKRKR